MMRVHAVQTAGKPTEAKSLSWTSCLYQVLALVLKQHLLPRSMAVMNTAAGF